MYVVAPHRFTHVTGSCPTLKVPKLEIFDPSDFHDFYTIKSLREGDFGDKIKIFWSFFGAATFLMRMLCLLLRSAVPSKQAEHTRQELMPSSVKS